jgi:hypothetical protein
MELHLQLLL